LLFAVYVDDIIGELKDSGLGCDIGSMFLIIAASTHHVTGDD